MSSTLFKNVTKKLFVNKSYIFHIRDVGFYSDLKRLTSRSLSSVKACYIESISPRTAQHLTLHKINPGQNSYLGVREINK